MVTITIRKIWIRKMFFLGLGTALMFVGGLFFELLYEMRGFAFSFDSIGSYIPFMMFIVMFIVMMGLFAWSAWCFFLVVFDNPPSISLKKYINIRIED